MLVLLVILWFYLSALWGAQSQLRDTNSTEAATTTMESSSPFCMSLGKQPLTYSTWFYPSIFWDMLLRLQWNIILSICGSSWGGRSVGGPKPWVDQTDILGSSWEHDTFLLVYFWEESIPHFRVKLELITLFIALVVHLLHVVQPY